MPRSVVVTVEASTAEKLAVLVEVKSRVLLSVLLPIRNPFW